VPFKKIGKGVYQGPSGRKFNLAQVRLYYAGGDHFPGQRGFKGTRIRKMAKGGVVPSNFSGSMSKHMGKRNSSC
jgi:hypothetical protein